MTQKKILYAAHRPNNHVSIIIQSKFPMVELDLHTSDVQTGGAGDQTVDLALSGQLIYPSSGSHPLICAPVRF